MIKAVHLRTEYLENPIGIDIPAPRLYWKYEGDSVRQSAYQIMAESESTSLWDSGKTISAMGVHIPYGGPTLQSGQRVTWKVRLWDEHDVASPWSEAAIFEMGLLTAQEWQATWISGDYFPQKGTRYPADYFRKTLVVEKPIKRARLYITACGLYVAYVDDTRVGMQKLTPGTTEYGKRLQYQTYDVTALLTQGNHSLVAAVGDGWFRGNIGARNMTNRFGDTTALLLQLKIEYEDGSHQLLCTGEDWQWTNQGPIRENDLKNGERFDARRRLEDAQWRSPRTVSYPTRLVCSDNVPVLEKEVFHPTILTTAKGETVLDFGQNMAGCIAFHLTAEAGHSIRIRLTEALDGAGNFTQENFQLPPVGKYPVLQQIDYICKDGYQAYTSEFTISGFRYALVENWPGKLERQCIEARAVYSDMERTGEFSCSNQLVNQLVKNTLWSMKSNFLDVPTDCPQRERAAWTGDAQVFFSAGSYLMNTAPFMRKWLRDLQDGQWDNGLIPNIVPTVGSDPIVDMMQGSVGWADAAVLIPYRYWKLYGDTGILDENREMMQRYADFIENRAKQKNPLRLMQRNPYRRFTCEVGKHWGEWSEPVEDKFESMLALGLPRPEEATAYFAYTMRLLDEIATARKWPQADQYRRNAEGGKKAYNYLFVKHEDIDAVRPAKLVRPLALGLLDRDARQNIARRLHDVMQKRNYQVGTGFLSTPFLLPVLAENGYVDTAYHILEQEKAPGWLYQVKNGATTIWENWTGYIAGKQLTSLNHYAGGSVCEWLFASVAGIRLTGTPYHFEIKPTPGGSLSQAMGSYDSIYGKVVSKWNREGNQTSFTIAIPANCTAEIILPDSRRVAVGPGTHTYAIATKECRT